MSASHSPPGRLRAVVARGNSAWARACLAFRHRDAGSVAESRARSQEAYSTPQTMRPW